MSRTDRFALAAAQTGLNLLGNQTSLAFLHNQRLMSEQIKTRRIGNRKIGLRSQLAFVEPSVRIGLVKVVVKLVKFSFAHKIDLCHADAVLSGDRSAKLLCDIHDIRDAFVGFTEHFHIVGVDRNICVNIAVPRMHMKRNEYSFVEHSRMNSENLISDIFKGVAGKNVIELFQNLLFPRDANQMILNKIEKRQAAKILWKTLRTLSAKLFQPLNRLLRVLIQMMKNISPLGLNLVQKNKSERNFLTEKLLLGVAAGTHCEFSKAERPIEIALGLPNHIELILNRAANIEAFHRVCIVADLIQRNHNVLVQLKGVGML